MGYYGCSSPILKKIMQISDSKYKMWTLFPYFLFHNYLFNFIYLNDNIDLVQVITQDTLYTSATLK